MATPYSRTLRSLKGDSSRPWILWSVIVSVFLASALGWALFSSVGLYVTSVEARVEAAVGGYPVEAEVEGTVARVRGGVGERVRAGELLVELGTQVLQLQVEEEGSAGRALEQELAVLEQRLATERTASRTAKKERAVKLEEERAWIDEARARLALAVSEARRAAELHEAGLLSDAELERAQSDERQRHAALSASELALTRLTWEHRDQSSERRGRIERLEAELAQLRGELNRTRVKIERLGKQIARHSLRAPVSGVLAEQQPLQPGETLFVGDRVATIVPAGDLTIVARFAPSDVLGRLHVGQPAVVRLHGFPWTQYGTVPAVVAEVASEVREGRVQAELRPTPDAHQGPPLSHGLPATVEVRVETVSPLTVALRAAGGGQSRSRSASERSGV